MIGQQIKKNRHFMLDRMSDKERERTIKNSTYLFLFLFSFVLSGCAPMADEQDTSSLISSEIQGKEIPYFEKNQLVTYDGEMSILDYTLVDDVEGNSGLLFLAEYKNLTDQKLIPLELWVNHFKFYQESEEEDVLLDTSGTLPESYEFDPVYINTTGRYDKGVDPNQSITFRYFIKLKNLNPVELSVWNTAGEEGYKIGSSTFNLE